MSLYLSPYVGKGSKQNPFRPVGSDQPGWSAIDLRADGGQSLDGGGFPYAMLWLPIGSVEDPSLIKLGDAKDELLAVSSRSILSSKTISLDFSRDTKLDDVLSTLLLRPPANGWNPLMPVNGRMEAWLGSDIGKQRWVDFPVLAGGSFSDNFNRANETPIAAPWTQLSGSSGTALRLNGNAMGRITTNGDMLYYYNSPAGWNADQASEFLYVSANNSNDWGPAVRVGSNNFSGYLFSQFDTSIDKYVNNVFSLIEAGAGSTATGSVYKIQIAGSTITYFKDGTPNANSPATDTSLATAGNGAGCQWFEVGGTIDNFLASGEIPALMGQAWL